MKKIIIMSILLSGCATYNIFIPERANELCKFHAGVKSYNYSTMELVCIDTTFIQLKKERNL